MKEVNLFVSTFDKGEGLLPWDKVVDLSDSTLLPGLSETQKRQLLSKPWNGYDDFNPNRILTATWKQDTGKWYWHDGVTPIDQPLNDPANTSTSFTLPKILTAGQNYNFAVEAISNSGAVTEDKGQFKTITPVSNNPFSSVSVLTPGFTLLPGNAGIDDSFYQMANKIATVSGNTFESSGLIMRYDKPTGNWVPIDKNGGEISALTGGLKTSDANYLSTLANNLKNGILKDGKKIEYLNQNKPLVLLPEWSLGNESVIPDVGFSEGAADALFASMVQLDQALGGGVGKRDNLGNLESLYDLKGDLIRTQGAVFNSPLHFVGFSRGAVVNSEIIQRFGTYFPNAGGTVNSDGTPVLNSEGKPIRDLQMTTVDPHDFYQPSLKLALPRFITTNFSDFYEPKVQVWNNVTFADNYYQTVADPNGFTATPNGRSLGELPQEELDKNPRPAGLNFPQVNGVNLGQPDLEVLLGTRQGEKGRENSLIGFTKDDMLGGPHKRANAWYAGTIDLNLDQLQIQYPHALAENVPEPIDDQLGERDINRWYDPSFPNAKPWYDNANGEGAGEGWFYSVLGGGKEQRTYSTVGRVPVSFDNTLSAGMRGDYAVPTLFNGNFDQYIPNKNEFEDFGRNLISTEIPGWSFHQDGEPNFVDPTQHLVDWKNLPKLTERVKDITGQDQVGTSYLENLGFDQNDPNYHNYALELKNGDSIIHNRFVVPDWGSLRFNLHVPEEFYSADQAKSERLNENFQPKEVKITLQALDDPNKSITKTILLEQIDFGKPSQKKRDKFDEYTRDIYGNPNPLMDASIKLDRATYEFETFQLDIPAESELYGKPATLKIDVTGSPNLKVYLDDVFFKSEPLKFGMPTNSSKNDWLIERPQYALSYNGNKNIANWASWKVNQSSLYHDPTWLEYDGSLKLFEPATYRDTNEDETLPNGFYKVKENDYIFTDLNGKERKGLTLGEINPNDPQKFVAYSLAHLVPAADRDENRSYILQDRRGEPIGEAKSKDGMAVNLMSNIVPMESGLNQGQWKVVEGQIRQFVAEGKEVYVIAGTYGDKGEVVLNPETSITIPEYLWKVVLVLPHPGADVTLDTYTAGYWAKNESGAGLMKKTVKEISSLTGYNFFSNIPSDIWEVIENQ